MYSEIFVAILILLVVIFFNNRYQYWRKKGVPFLPPRFPLGNTNVIFPKGFSVGILTKKFYDEFKKRGDKFGGVYLVIEPNLVVIDPEYIKNILCKDFQHFLDRGFYYNEKDDPVSAHLFAVDGAYWRSLRVKLSPTFTSGKMKMMFQTVVDCCNYMKEAINENLGKDIEIKEFLARFGTDVIGSCAFGIDCNSFKYPDAEFRMMGKSIFEFSKFRSLKSFFMINFPKLSLRLGLCPMKKKVGVFFRKIVAETISMRESHNIKRNDFLQILMELKDTHNLSLDAIAAQAFLFFIAGFETSSTAMTFALYELARNEKVQKKLREELVEVMGKYGNQITYQSLSEMKYLDQVLDETLRMYPPIVTLNRRCTKSYMLGDSNFVIEEGTPLLIPVLGLHMDPEYFPEPGKFDPDRFSEENKKNRHAFVHLPFGDGPRNCIGLRFGLMQSKIGVATVIKNFAISVSSATKPLEFDPYSFLLRSVNDIYLHIKKI